MQPTRHRNLLAAAASLALVSTIVAPNCADAKREADAAQATLARSSEPQVVRTTLPGAWKADVEATTGRVLSAWRNIPALLGETATNASRAAVDGSTPAATGNANVASISQTRATVESARRVLLEWEQRLQLDDGLADLVLKYERHGLARDVFVFQQTIDGVPVLDGEIGITLWNDEPIMIFSGYVPRSRASGGASVARSSAPSIGSGEAEARIRSELLSRFGLSSLVEPRSQESPAAASPTRDARSTAAPSTLVWYRTPDDALALGYLVRLALDSPRGDWVGVVDAVTSEVAHLADNARYATATGRVFHPNPVVTLQNTSLSDQNDTDQGNTFNAAYQTVTLRDVELSQGTYKLRGPYVGIVDFSEPSVAAPERADSLFFFTRSQEEFEAVNAYYHIDRAQRYIQSLGYTGVRAVAAYRVMIDVHALGGADNSEYRPSQKSIAFGDGCVDDAEDADVIYHEYGHAIQDDQVYNFGCLLSGGPCIPARSIGEGFGDYWSSSLASQIGGEFDEAQVFDWDLSGCWAGRRVDTNLTMADYHPSDIYKNGSIWSSALWDIRAATGSPISDRLVIESHFGLPPNTTFEQNATSLAMADVTLFGGSHLPSILDAFADRGIEVDTTGLGPDTLAPSITVAVLQNPLLGNYLDVVVHGSESLAPASIDGTFEGTALQFELQDLAGRIFRAERRISAAGAFTIVVTAADASGNDTTVERGFTAGVTSRDLETTVASFDGALAVSFPAGALPGGTWIVVSDEARAADDVAPSEIAYEIAASGRALSMPAQLTLVRSPFGGSTENLSITLGDGSGELPATFDPVTGSLRASLPALGTIVVRSAPDAGERASLASLRLGPASPNPSAGGTRIVIESAAPQTARLAVYSAAGRLVRTLFDGRARAGLSEIVWDGNDGAGRAVPSGVYFFRVDGERGRSSRKVVIAR